MISVDSFAQLNEIYSNQNNRAVWSTWGDNMNGALLNDFVNAVRDGKPVPISGEDGMKSAMIAFAAYESAKNKAPVRP